MKKKTNCTRAGSGNTHRAYRSSLVVAMIDRPEVNAGQAAFSGVRAWVRAGTNAFAFYSSHTVHSNADVWRKVRRLPDLYDLSLLVDMALDEV